MLVATRAMLTLGMFAFGLTNLGCGSRASDGHAIDLSGKLPKEASFKTLCFIIHANGNVEFQVKRALESKQWMLEEIQDRK